MDSEDWPIKQVAGYRQPLNNKWEAPGAVNSLFLQFKHTVLAFSWGHPVAAVDK